MNIQPLHQGLVPAALQAPAPAAPAGNFYEHAASLLMALTPDVRNTLRTAHNTLAATQGELIRLTNPECSDAEYLANTERLALDIRDLRQAMAPHEEGLHAEPSPELQALQSAHRSLLTCLDRLVGEFFIRQTGREIRDGHRSFQHLMTAARECWREKQLRRHPEVAGGAPIRTNPLRCPDETAAAAINPSFQETLSARELNQVIERLAGLTFEMMGGGYQSHHFAAWFAIRAVLNAFQIGPRAVSVTGEWVENLRNQHRHDRDAWVRAFIEALTPTLDVQDFANFLQLAMQQHGPAWAGLVPAAQALDGVAHFSPLPEVGAAPVAQAADDPAWDDIQTPPASPRG